MSECPSHTHIYINKHALTHSVRFCKGDVFLVTNADDTEWWQAKKIDAVQAIRQRPVAQSSFRPVAGRNERNCARQRRYLYNNFVSHTHTHTHTLSSFLSSHFRYFSVPF